MISEWEFRMVIVNVIVWGFIVGVGGWLNWDDLKQAWGRFKERVKPVRDWLSKQLVNNPFLFAIIIVFILALIEFIALFLGRLYPLTESLYQLVFKHEVGNIKIGSRAFQNVSFLIAGSATFSFAVLGMFLSVIRNILTRHQNNISQQAQITESMGRAIEQIGAFNDKKPNIVVRLGGLYSLQFITQDSPRHEKSIARIFYAYVYENIKRDKDDKPKVTDSHGKEVYQLPEDIKVAISIMGQFSKEILRDSQLNLLDTDFTEYYLAGMDFSYINLQNLNLSDADLSDADLSGADLSKTDLSKTDLSGADLVGANLSDTILFNTDLTDANLSKAKNLTQEQIYQTFGSVAADGGTQLPYDLIPPKHWKNLDEEEPDEDEDEDE